jgi:hypothetical protein
MFAPFGRSFERQRSTEKDLNFVPELVEVHMLVFMQKCLMEI